MTENPTCRGCGAPVEAGRMWCPPYVSDCLAQYRASTNYRAATLKRDGFDCARCFGWWNRAVLADRWTGRLRLWAAIVFGVVGVFRGRKPSRTRKVIADHIDPIGGTGSHAPRNLQVLCEDPFWRHNARKTVRDIARLKGQRAPLDRPTVVRWALVVVAVAAVGFQLLTPDLRNAIRVDPMNGLVLTARAAVAPTVLVPLAVIALAVALAVVVRKLRARTVTRLAQAIAQETNASDTMKRQVRVKRWGRVPGHRMPQPVDIVVSYPHTFRDDDPAAIDRVEGRVRSKLGWSSCAVTLEPHRDRMRLRYPDPFLTAPSTRSPLLGKPSNDLYDPTSVAVDEQFKDVSLRLVERNVLIGGEPGGGKSNVLSLLLAAAAMDRNVDLWLMDGKEVEFPLWAPCAERMVVGADEEAHKRAREMLADLQAVVNARQALLKESSTLDEVVRKVSHDDGMGLILLAIDELATYTTGWKKADVDAFVASLRDIIQRGRALGVIVLLATQRPSADVVPTSIRDIVGFRWALRCLTPTSSDMILGAGLASQGFNAARVPAEARGTGYLLAEGSSPRKVRAHFVNDADLVRLARQARVLRGVEVAEGTTV